MSLSGRSGRALKGPAKEVQRMAEQVVVVRSCPVCGESDTLVTMGRDIDSRGRLRREWVIEVDCANEACATHAQTS